jgi:hypothetical protein
LGDSILSPLRTCSRCGIEKNIDDFALRNTAKGLVPRTYCKACDVPQKPTAEENRRRQLMRLYKITPQQLTEMGEAQGWKCRICHTDIRDRPYVDHDHVSGKVRKLLCMNCNAGLGQFKDNPMFLQAAIDYLVREKRNIEWGLDLR